MIEFLEGRLIEKTPTHLVIDVGGVGYFVNISLYTYGKVGTEEKIKVHTHLSIKEDAHTLYGFLEKEERELFRQLISVNGVGAGTARMILSSLSPSEVSQAIAKGDAGTLQRIKGIGAKSALRIIIDLKDKIRTDDSHLLLKGSGNTMRDESLSALLALGFGKAQIEKVMDGLAKKGESPSTVEELIKLALKNL